MVMRKIVLSKFVLQSGEVEFKDYRLVVVNHETNDTEEDLIVRASTQAKNWIEATYPHSKLISLVCYPTIGEDLPKEENVVQFDRAQLASFGRYLLSPERTESITSGYKDGDPVSLQDRLKEVYHADVENWKEGIKESQSV